jgi:SAM-dependent methyltransferase
VEPGIWDEQAAARYDTPGTGMFAPEVLGPAVERLAELAQGGRALELAIGTGRVAIPLAQRGVPVAGIELSQPMLDRLRDKVDETTIPVVLGDMASARAEGQYSLVYLVFNTISNLLSQAEQVACFRNAVRHLTPDGRFVIELWVPQLRELPPGREATVFTAEAGYIGLDTYDVVRQHVVSHHFEFGEGTQARLFRSPHRYIWPAELDLMAELAGLELESRSADWSGAEFTADSPSHVSVYRVAAAAQRSGTGEMSHDGSAEVRAGRHRHDRRAQVGGALAPADGPGVRPGHETPLPGVDDPQGRDWLNLSLPGGTGLLAFQPLRVFVDPDGHPFCVFVG